jgi:molecular chaperone GrpE
MASDSTAGGAPDDMPVASSDSTGPEATVETLQRVVESLQAENADLHDKHLRAVADSHNIRRRAQQDVEKANKFGVERFARDTLSVADNLGRALGALPANLEALDPGLRNVIAGVQATERELLSILERHGVTRIEALGKPFNAEFHQAMMEIEDPSVAAGTVVQELIPGYLLAGRLLRAAMVGVSKGGPARTPEARTPEASNDA